MPQKRELTHALFVKWRDVEIGAFGIPAIAAFVFVVITLLGARWLGLI